MILVSFNGVCETNEFLCVPIKSTFPLSALYWFASGPEEAAIRVGQSLITQPGFPGDPLTISLLADFNYCE